MAAFELIIPKGKYENSKAVENVINYICRLDQPEQVGGIGVYPLWPNEMIDQFNAVKKFYGKTLDKQIFHIVVTIDKSLNFSVEEIMEMAYKIAMYWGNERQVVFAVHDDTQYKHVHFGINTVAYTNGEFKAFYDINNIRNYVNQIVQVEIDRKWFGRNN